MTTVTLSVKGLQVNIEVGHRDKWTSSRIGSLGEWTQANGKKGSSTALKEAGAEQETVPMLGGEELISQRIGMGAWPSSLRPAIAGGPSPNRGGAEGPHGGPQMLHI